MSVRRRRQWVGKAKDPVKRKVKGWAWILEEREGYGGSPSVRGETLFSQR